MLTALGLILGSYGSSFAQDDDSNSTAKEEEQVLVTGTYIPRQVGNSSSPTNVIVVEELNASGANTIADITQQLTINTGAQNYTDAFTQNVSTGTSNINLRGLGISSTLVLLNGKRQVVSGAPTDAGLTFVDTSSLVPFIALERIEIVKDGGGALYGSDAVAGVVNFITRNDFEGLELSARAQSVTEDSQLDLNVGAIFGIGNGATHFTAAFEYMHRSSLTTAERRFPGSLDPVNGDFSNAGFPGSFIVPYLPTGLPAPIQAAWSAYFDSGNPNGIADALEPLLGLPPVPGSITPVLTDPSCAAGDNSVLPSTFPIGFCRLDFGDYYDLVSEEERILGHVTLTHDFNEDVSFFLEGSIALNEAMRNNSPSFPVPGPHAVLANVPGTSAPYNPFNPFGLSPVLAGPSTLPLFFIGRSVGQGPAAPSYHDSDTWRIHARFDGNFGDNGTWELSFTHAVNKFKLRVNDVLTDRWDLALNGLGGSGCNPATGVPGLGGCQFFNPFGTSLTASPGATVPGPFGGTVPVVNDPALLAWMTGEVQQDYLSKLTVAEGIITNGFDAGLSGGDISYAVGFQYRKSVYNLTWDAQSNADNYLFILGGPNFATNLDSYSFFGEFRVPFTERVELQAAVRYENYGGTVGSSVDPKVGIYAEVSDTFSLRGSFGTSFRAPTGFQQFGTQTSLQQLIDTLPGQPTTPQFFAVRTAGTGTLVPEEATNWNFGFTWAPTDRLTLEFDYWWFDFDNIIVQESAQAILNANPLDPRIIRSAVTGGVVRIDSSFVNASSLKTSGFDINAEYLIPMDKHGDLIFGFNATHISKYDLVDPQAGPVSGAGVRNFNNFGTSTPQWRFVGSANWRVNQHDIYVFVRFIDSYLDDQNNLPISSHTTVDLQYNFYIGDQGDERAWRFSVGVINLFNNFPPTVLTNQGFDTKVHDPRGRMIYGQFSKAF